jgi:hypothetical protein
MSKCDHEIWHMETACADGLCPLCLQITVKELREQNARLAKKYDEAKSLAKLAIKSGK